MQSAYRKPPDTVASHIQMADSMEPTDPSKSSTPMVKAKLFVLSKETLLKGY